MKTAIRILLAVLFSPIWLPTYALMLVIVTVAAIGCNVVSFIVRGELENGTLRMIPEFATLRLFKHWASATKER